MLSEFKSPTFVKTQNKDIIFNLNGNRFYIVTKEYKDYGASKVEECLKSPIKIMKKVPRKFLVLTEKYIEFDYEYKYVDNLSYVETLAKEQNLI